MRAAGLHAIHTLMTSEAVLIRSKRSRTQNADADSILINKITSRIAGVIAANKYVLCEYNVPRKFLDNATAITPGRRAATVSPLDDPDWVAVSSMVLKKHLADIMDKLTETGATDILVIGIVSSASSPRHIRLHTARITDSPYIAITRITVVYKATYLPYLAYRRDVISFPA